jgi:hypothetical protein
MVALLWAEEIEAAIRLEELWNDLAAYLLSALRLSITNFQSGRRRRALSENLRRASAVIPDESYTALSWTKNACAAFPPRRKVQALDRETDALTPRTRCGVKVKWPISGKCRQVAGGSDRRSCGPTGLLHLLGYSPGVRRPSVLSSTSMKCVYSIGEG